MQGQFGKLTYEIKREMYASWRSLTWNLDFREPRLSLQSFAWNVRLKDAPLMWNPFAQMHVVPLFSPHSSLFIDDPRSQERSTRGCSCRVFVRNSPAHRQSFYVAAIVSSMSLDPESIPLVSNYLNRICDVTGIRPRATWHSREKLRDF